MKKIIFVTGASSGIGKALSVKFANSGWKVLASARRLDLLKKLDKESNNLNSIIPGSDHWPSFLNNQSERFESRIVMININKSNSIFTTDMQNSKLPIVISHGEGRASLSKEQFKILSKNDQILMNYIDDSGNATNEYPFNPNGSFEGIAGVSSVNGNVTLMMPHPERYTNICQFPVNSDDNTSPWLKFFYNARMHLK